MLLSGVSIVDFEHANADWVMMQLNLHSLAVFVGVIFEFCDIILYSPDLSKFLFIILCVK